MCIEGGDSCRGWSRHVVNVLYLDVPNYLISSNNSFVTLKFLDTLTPS